MQKDVSVSVIRGKSEYTMLSHSEKVTATLLTARFPFAPCLFSKATTHGFSAKPILLIFFNGGWEAIWKYLLIFALICKIFTFKFKLFRNEKTFIFIVGSCKPDGHGRR